MTDIEINKALALAIGYLPEHVRVVDWGNGPFVQVWRDEAWRGFDYLRWDVISPIAERYNCFPSQEYSYIHKDFYWEARRFLFEVTAETAAAAIALAVIRGSK